MDSEPAEIEGEAAENGDTGDTGAELDDGMGVPRVSPLHLHGPPLCSPLGDSSECFELRREKNNTHKTEAGSSGEKANGSSGSFLLLPLT